MSEDPEVRFHVLGSWEVVGGGGLVAPARQLRVLLAALLVLVGPVDAGGSLG